MSVISNYSKCVLKCIQVAGCVCACGSVSMFFQGIHDYSLHNKMNSGLRVCVCVHGHIMYFQGIHDKELYYNFTGKI